MITSLIGYLIWRRKGKLDKGGLKEVQASAERRIRSNKPEKAIGTRADIQYIDVGRMGHSRGREGIEVGG